MVLKLDVEFSFILNDAITPIPEANVNPKKRIRFLAQSFCVRTDFSFFEYSSLELSISYNMYL